MVRVAYTRGAVAAYEGIEFAETGGIEMGYMRVEVGDRLEVLSSDTAGHTRKALATYLYCRKIVDEFNEEAGWMPSSCLS